MPSAAYLALAVALFSLAIPAHAYLDPGTGSMILQVILGGVAGLAVAGKLYWYKILSFFGKDKAPDEDAGKEKAEEPPKQS